MTVRHSARMRRRFCELCTIDGLASASSRSKGTAWFDFLGSRHPNSKSARSLFWMAGSGRIAAAAGGGGGGGGTRDSDALPRAIGNGAFAIWGVRFKLAQGVRRVFRWALAALMGSRANVHVGRGSWGGDPCGVAGLRAGPRRFQGPRVDLRGHSSDRNEHHRTGPNILSLAL